MKETRGVAILRAIGEYLNRNTMYIDCIAEPDKLISIIEKEIDEQEIRKFEAYHEVSENMKVPF